jgi:hypothetical protein
MRELQKQGYAQMPRLVVGRRRVPAFRTFFQFAAVRSSAISTLMALVREAIDVAKASKPR